jgi:hypothetical protein
MKFKEKLKALEEDNIINNKLYEKTMIVFQSVI